MTKFLGRQLDTRTMMFGDIPWESADSLCRLAVETFGEQGQGAMILGRIERLKNRGEISPDEFNAEAEKARERMG